MRLTMELPAGEERGFARTALLAFSKYLQF